ncbi:MAG: SusC/RagA family TonB-linked outer membrane protein [Muribaculaceae bacterium]|nr:SusC/RagA family TonB-linked outer membrane protein [Muribaculaceae bacterium]
MKRHLALLGALMLLCGTGYQAQATPAPQVSANSATSIVTGRVVDEQGEPVIGASIVEVGTTRGTSTDVDGNFSFKASPNAKLQISFIGYKTQELRASNGMRVVLAEDNAKLDEVVVVGYGTQRKANLTGAVSTVDVDKVLGSKSETDVRKSLQGTVPGLTILNANGDISADPSIVIRGIGTLSNSGVSNPLYIVDGVPVESLGDLNPADIENISVLKDAASTSIYGTRAAFGVVLITTRTAHVKDNVRVNYNNNFAWSQATTLPDYPNVPTQVSALNDVNHRMGVASELFGMYMDSEAFQNGINNWIKKHGDIKDKYRQMVYGDDYDENGYYANWDVPGIMFNNHAPSQSHTLSVTGNSGRINFYTSVGYNQKQSLMNFNPDKFRKYNATANISVRATDWLEVGTRISYVDRTYETPYKRGAGTYQYLWRWGSFFGPYGYFVDPNDGKQYDARTMIGGRNTGGDCYYKMNNLSLGAFAKIDFGYGLSFNADYTFIKRDTRYKGVGLPSVVYNTWGLNPQGPVDITGSTFIETDRSNRYNHVANGYFDWHRSINDAHNFNFKVGANVDKYEYEYLYYERHGIQDLNMPELALCNEDYSYSHSHTHWGSAGFFGRINYDYKGIWLLELNGRYDGSSKFPKKDQWAFFPSASIGWRISEMGFWTPIKNTISNAKIRASYGVIGNQEIGSNMFLETMGKVTNGVNWVGTGNSKYDYFGAPKLVSESLTWEKIHTTNVGLDLAFFNGHLNVTADWYQRDTKDMLAPGKAMPSVLGASAAWENAGSMRTRGWEVAVDYRNRIGAVDFYVTAIVNDYKTKVTTWDSNNMINTNYSGKEYGEIWGFETDRYFDFKDFNADGTYAAGVADQTKLQSNGFVYGPGDIKFKDLNGDGVIDWGKGTPEDHGDLKRIGNFTPRYQYSLRLGAAWKGFDVDFYLQGVGKRDMWTQSAFVMPFMRGADAIYTNQTSYVTEADYAAGRIDQNADFPRMWAGGAGRGTASSDILDLGKFNFYPQTKYLVNMSYLRMKNITVGYTLPQNWTRKALIEKLRIYASTDNLFDIINHNNGTGLDPEINTGVGSYGNAVWGRTDPIMRTYSVGLQLTFGSSSRTAVAGPVDNSALNAQINDLRAQLADAENGYNARLADLQNQLNAANNRNAQLQKDLNECQKSKGNMIDKAQQYMTVLCHFPVNKTAVTADQQPNVERIAAYMKSHPGSTCEIKGYASPEGPQDHNIKLAEGRAASVKDMLVKKYGIDAKRIKAAGQGISNMFDELSWNRVSICEIIVK